MTQTYEVEGHRRSEMTNSIPAAARTQNDTDFWDGTELCNRDRMKPMPTRMSLRGSLSTVLVAIAAVSTIGLAGIISVVGAAPASAHAELVRITPARHAQLPTAPREVVLELSQPVSDSFATVVVTTAEGVTVTSGKPSVIGAKVTQTLRSPLAGGTYRVAFRLVSKDGHPVTGESDFTVALVPGAKPSTTAPSEPSLATPSAHVADAAPTRGPPLGQDGGAGWSTRAIAGAVGLVIMGSGLLLWRRRRP